ncbi:hypothetical protein [Streptomyces sp. NPDC046727]|uniref:hypothetical protein n=1 Tax=Streptomyces sp. NPDC046727 TaxID=3155373 RepID=UPI0033CC79DA
MGELGIALIAAGSALAGSIVTGWFTRSAGHRQAAAAQHAGDRQADALLQTVQETLKAQRVANDVANRRLVLAEFVRAAETARRAVEADEIDTPKTADLERAKAVLEVELYPDDAAGYDICNVMRRVARTALIRDEGTEYRSARDLLIREAFHALRRTERDEILR